MRHILFAAALALVTTSVGCAHTANIVPADSPLAKISHDMPQATVESILGPPTSTNQYLGGKAFSPVNFGGDSGVMLEAHYKGLGRVVYNVERFSLEKKVDEVVYDPADPGHN